MNRKDLQALTLLGSTTDNPVLDPLAVLHQDNLIYMRPRGEENHENCFKNN